MPFELTGLRLPAGIAVSAGQEGDTVEVATREFVANMDGDVFLGRVESIVDSLLSQRDLQPSRIDHLFAVLRRDGSATVFVDELELRPAIRPKKGLKAGDPVTLDDILHVGRFWPDEVEVEPDDGIVALISARWRKGLLYDFGPLHGEARSYDLGDMLGACYGRLLFHETLGVGTDADLVERLLAAEWFPFRFLSTALTKKTIGHLKSGLALDGVIHEARSEMLARRDELVALLTGSPVFGDDHWPVIERGLERYEQADYVSCISVLLPRVEGALRSYRLQAGLSGKAQHADLLRQVELNRFALRRHLYSPLLEAEFRRYATEVLFAKFNPDDPEGAGRHPVTHGVSVIAEFSEKRASACLLALTQLAYILGDPAKRHAGDDVVLEYVNGASKAQLLELPGVGPAKAKAVVKAREKGGIGRIADLKRIVSFGDSRMDNLRRFFEGSR